MRPRRARYNNGRTTWLPFLQTDATGWVARDQTTPSRQVLRINSMDVLTSRHLARTVKSPVALAVSLDPYGGTGPESARTPAP